MSDQRPMPIDFCLKSDDGRIAWIAHCDMDAYRRALVEWQAREIERLRGLLRGVLECNEGDAVWMEALAFLRAADSAAVVRKRKSCPRCYGKSPLCHRCQGTGMIDAPTSADDPSCPDCDGEGTWAK